MALPSDHIYIQTAMSLRGSPSGATIGVHLAPRSSESRHGEWLNTCRLDVHVNEWPAEGYHELMVMARRQVVILSEKLRSASFDFTEAHMYGHIPSGWIDCL